MKNILNKILSFHFFIEGVLLWSSISSTMNFYHMTLFTFPFPSIQSNLYMHINYFVICWYTCTKLHKLFMIQLVNWSLAIPNKHEFPKKNDVDIDLLVFYNRLISLHLLCMCTNCKLQKLLLSKLVSWFLVILNKHDFFGKDKWHQNLCTHGIFFFISSYLDKLGGAPIFPLVL